MSDLVAKAPIDRRLAEILTPIIEGMGFELVRVRLMGGQTKTVHVHKLIVADSVEENVLQLQTQKRKLLQDVFEASEIANAPISIDDLKSLL